MSEKNEIIFHQIRNCTTKLTYAGIHILIDPFLVPKDYYPGYSTNSRNEKDSSSYE